MLQANRRRDAKASYAFTIVEVLIVVAVLLILAALLFPVFRGAKGRSNHMVTMSRLSQMYKAMLIYGGDYDVFDEAPGLGNVPAYPIEMSRVLEPYGARGDILHSAAFPDAGKERWPTSFVYLWVTTYWANGTNEPPENSQAARNRARLLEERGEYVIVSDHVHDYYEFWPSEKSSDPYMQRRFEINLRVNGSVKAERRPGIRGTILPF